MFTQNWALSSSCYSSRSFIMFPLCQYSWSQSLYWATGYYRTTQPGHTHCRWRVIGPAGRARYVLCVCVCLILLWILEGKVFISKLPIASGLTEILTLTHLSLSISFAVTFFLLFQKPPVLVSFSCCEQQCFPSSCQAHFTDMFEISQSHPISTNFNKVNKSARQT